MPYLFLTPTLFEVLVDMGLPHPYTNEELMDACVDRAVDIVEWYSLRGYPAGNIMRLFPDVQAANDSEEEVTLAIAEALYCQKRSLNGALAKGNL